MSLKLYFSRVQKLRREDGGVAAMEFALLAPVFFLLLFGIIEVALVFFSDMMLQNATLDASRFVRTGVAARTLSEEDFVDTICKKAFILKNCNSKLKYQVKILTNYNTRTAGIVVGNYAGLKAMTNEYSVGDSEDIMLVRAFYEWNLFTGFIRDVFSTPGTNVRVVGGSVVFRNEPY